MMDILGYLSFAALLGLIPGELARRKGQSFLFYWFVGFLFLPGALILVFVKDRNPRAIEARQLAQGMRKCPHCAELVKAEATLCRYCQQPLPTRAAPAATPAGRFKTRDDYERWKANRRA